MQNKLYEHTMQSLIAADKRKTELEQNFNQSKIGDYEETCKNRLSYAVELIKMGTDCEIKDDEINILAEDGTIMTFSANDIKEKLGTEKFGILFPEAVEVEEDDFNDYFDADEQTVIDQPINPLQPVLNIIQALMMPQNRSSSYMTAPINDPVKNIADYVDSLKAANEKAKTKLKSIYNENRQYIAENKRLESDINNKLTKIDNLSTQIDELTSQNNDLLKEQADLKNGFEEELEKNNSLSKQIIELEEIEDSLRKANIALEDEKASFLIDKEEFSKSLTTLNQDIDALSEENKSLTQALSDKEAEKEQFLSQIKKLETSLNDVKENPSVKKELSDLKEENMCLKKENDALIKERENIVKEKNELTNKIAGFNKKIEELSQKVSSLTNKNEELSKSAFLDNSLKIGNFNSFQNRFSNLKEKLSLVAVVQVHDISNINMLYTEEVGDKVIKLTVDKLIEKFGEDNVYRIRGAQFGILLKSGDKNLIDKKLYSIKKELNETKDIIISYGIAYISDESRTRDSSLSIAKMELNAYANAPTEETAANENVDLSLLKKPADDPYANSNIIEADGTSVDMAALFAGR